MPRTVRTKSGRTLSDADIDRLADRAEKGLDLSTWTPRRGRPSLDASVGAHSPRIAVRVPRSLHDRVTVRAAREGRSISDIVRILLEAYAGTEDRKVTLPTKTDTSSLPTPMPVTTGTTATEALLAERRGDPR
jgi:plasmid stability protein